MRSVQLLVGLSAGLALAGCANDPLYIPGPMTLEAGVDVMGTRTQATASVQLPIKTETAADKAKDDALAATLGVDVPYVKVGDLEIDVEWTIKNLDTTDGLALIELDGANELYVYDPTMINLDPGNDEAPPAPGLAGNIPIPVPKGGEVSGLFTEDDLREAAIDLDQITRGHINPFRASLTISKNAKEFQPLTMADPTMPDLMQMPDGPAVPREAFAEIIRIDLVFKPSVHMTLDYNIRVRDIRGIMHSLLLTAETEKPDELQHFDPADYAVGPPRSTTP